LSLFVMLKNAKRINGAGAYLYIGDLDSIKFSQKNFKEKLHENLELQKVFMDEVIALLKKDLDTSVIDISEGKNFNYDLCNQIISQMNQAA